MAGKLEDYLARELNGTGYPLEIEISSMLDKTHFVSNNKYFLDRDENKAREIDITASPRQQKYDDALIRPFSVNHHLVIECKKSNTHAWVFLTRPVNRFWFQGQCIDFLSLATKDAGVCFIDDILSTCKNNLHYGSFERVASAYAEIGYRGQKSKKSEIFEAKNQIVKFLAYDISLRLKILRSRGFKPKDLHLIVLYHPTIVFDGKLYEAIVTNGSPRMFERKHLLLSTQYSPAYIGDFPGTEVPELDYLIDVVRKDFVADFLRILENDYLTLSTCISSNIGKLNVLAKSYLQEISRR